MLRAILFVGLGSAGGGILRYLVGKWVHNLIASSFPLGTMAVNVLGCFVIGLVYGIFDRGTSGDMNMQLLLATGFCGGFTTFSSFINENYTMLQNGNLLHFALYTGVSVVLGLLVLFFAHWLIKIA